MKTLSLILLLCFLASSSLLSSTAYKHTLLIESAGKKVAYSLDGVSLPLNKLLDSTTDIVGKDMQTPIAIIFDDTIGLHLVSVAREIFNKIGFQNVPIFARSRKTDRMSEVTFGKPVAFTLSSQ